MRRPQLAGLIIVWMQCVLHL